MSRRTECDGCGRELYKLGNRKGGAREHVIHGERVDGMSGGGIPDGEFDLCDICAKIAFCAIGDALSRELRT